VLGFLTGLYPVGFEGRIHYKSVTVFSRLSQTLWTGIWKSTSVRLTVSPSLWEHESLEEDRGRRRRWLRRLRRDRRSRRESPLVLPSGPLSSPPPPPVTTRFPDDPIPALGEASIPGVRPAVNVWTAPAMSARSSSRRNSRKYMTAGEEETSGGGPLASRRPRLAGVGVHSCLPLDVPVLATAGLGISVVAVGTLGWRTGLSGGVRGWADRL